MEKYLYTYLRGLDKSDLGTFGETLVLEKLKAMNFDVVNANTIQSNYKYIDLFCTNPKNHQTIGIQVKTSFDTNIPIGITFFSPPDKLRQMSHSQYCQKISI